MILKMMKAKEKETKGEKNKWGGDDDKKGERSRTRSRIR
jgi:hypothetical protein